jgi:TRAP transporter 4TM/12TM fusion protein
MAPASDPVPARGTDLDQQMVEVLPYRDLRGPLLWLFVLLTLAANLIVLNQLLNLGFFARVTLIENRYLYLLAALILPLVFLAYPLNHAERAARVPWIDGALALLALGTGLYFAWNAERILAQGWEYGAPKIAIAISAVLLLLITEAVRRTGGGLLAIIVTVVALYPVVADKMPGPLSGIAQTLPDTVAYHIVSAESAFGIPLKAFGELVVGFIVFGVALNYTGAGKFFNDIAFALVGHIRGGAAQVGVVSSALQGSISGSVISNVISSGVITIPAMKRTGFSPIYAGAVESVASTGATIMPPVMGSTAFIMASFLGIPYGEIALAATIPAVLFYFGLMVQIDAYSARRNLRGLTAGELPRFAATIREGWPYIVVFAVLIYFMLEESNEAMAPYYATAVMLVINQLKPGNRMSAARFVEFLAATGRSLGELVAILAGAGFIIGAFSVTGLAGTLVNDLVYMAGSAPLMLLLMGAITSFIFGLGLTVTACYIFLAIVLAPPLVKAGMDPLAVHLFIMYWGMVSFITPPVALACFAAAPIARASQMSIGMESMRMGSTMYFVPFFFVLNPALILRGSPEEIIVVTVTAFIGVLLIGAALQGYLIGVGATDSTPLGWTARLLMAASGVAFALPENQVPGLTQWELIALAIALAAGAILLMRSRRPAAAVAPSAE